MAWNPRGLTKVAALIEEAHKHAGALPDETHQSYPIPVADPKGLRAMFLYCRSKADADVGLRLSAPGYQALVRAETGRFERLTEITPGELGQAHGEEEEIGVYALPEGMSAEAFVASRDRLFRLYDLLLPAFAAGQTRVPDEVRRAAAEFQPLFWQLTEPPLRPYYLAAGKAFFSWLQAVARGQ